ncbi:hypothetical protein BJV82DRAFT_672428 [Fennellomyces sp. T-0311]|nr:hypothetical protein BJV82DRAFT_672428 [Fennellomyces sp. T-0311]
MTNPKYINCQYCGLPATKSTYNKHIEDCPTRKYLESQGNDASEMPTYSTVPGMGEDIIMENSDSCAAATDDHCYTKNHGEQLSSSVLDDGFEQYDYRASYYREVAANRHDEDIGETGANRHDEDTDGTARSIHHVDAANANSTGRINDDDGDEDAENVIDDDSTPHRSVVDDNPLR